MKVAQVLLSVVLLGFLSCAGTFQDTREYAACQKVEATQSEAPYTMAEAQAFANTVTDGEGLPLIRAFISYRYLPESLNMPDAIAAYFDDTRTIFSALDTIQYRYLIHELAHAVCGTGPRPRCEGPPHGPSFVEMERYLFSHYHTTKP